MKETFPTNTEEEIIQALENAGSRDGAVQKLLATELSSEPIDPICSGATARRRGASRAPFLRNFGKPIKARKFGYDVTVRASERPNAVRTDCGGGGKEPRGNEECYLFLAGFLKKTHFYCHVNK